MTPTRIFWDDEVDSNAAERTSQRELLEHLSPMHRGAVSLLLDLPRKSTARQIAATFNDKARLEEILDELSTPARKALLRSVFDEAGDVPEMSGIDCEPRAVTNELESRGLVFAFLVGRKLVYHVPADLRVPLRCALMGSYASSVTSGSAQRWIAAERQDLHDTVALWTLLKRNPVPLTEDAEIMANSKPRMLTALSAIEYPDPDQNLAEQRLALALRYLRDNAHLRVRANGYTHGRPKLRLEATGDLAATLISDKTTLQGYSYVGYRQYREGKEIVACAQSLGEALVGQDVGLMSFGQVLHDLIGDVLGRYAERLPPQELTLDGLLPGWLRGELQIGSSRRKPAAIRFVSSRRSSAQQVRVFADQLRGHPAKDEPTECDPDAPNYDHRYNWTPREPSYYIGGFSGWHHQPELISTLGSTTLTFRES